MAMLVDGSWISENRAKARAVKLSATSFITMICLFATVMAVFEPNFYYPRRPRPSNLDGNEISGAVPQLEIIAIG